MYYLFINNASLRHTDSHSIAVGGGHEQNRCLRTANKTQKEEEEDGDGIGPPSMRLILRRTMRCSTCAQY